jgi:hypothetical protein
MSQGIPPGYVLPTPQRAKLVGTLNIIFASLLLLYILFQIAMLFMMPMIMQMSGDMVKQAQAKVDQQREDRLAELKKEAAEAKTDEEKAQIKQNMTALEKAAPAVTMPNMSVVTDAMKDPAYLAYVWGDMISGLVLNVAMLISGIGLLQLSERNRRLALWTFALKILRLCFLAVLMILIIIPMTSRMTSEMMGGMAQGGAGGPPAAMMGDLAKFQAAIGSVQAVLGAVFGSIWPIIGIILLTRPGTRAACLARASLAKPRVPVPDEGLS